MKILTFVAIMSFHRNIFLPLLGLFVLCAHSTLACGDGLSSHSGKQETMAVEKSCCEKKEATDSSCAGQKTAQHSGKSCPCSHDTGGCHCPGCSVVCHSSVFSAVAMNTALPPAFSSLGAQKMAFYFADHLPQAVYLPIWQPPKIGA